MTATTAAIIALVAASIFNTASIFMNTKSIRELQRRRR